MTTTGQQHKTWRDPRTYPSGWTVPVQASTIKVGGYAMIQGRPCKVMERSVSK